MTRFTVHIRCQSCRQTNNANMCTTYHSIEFDPRPALGLNYSYAPKEKIFTYQQSEQTIPSAISNAYHSVLGWQSNIPCKTNIRWCWSSRFWHT